MCIDFKNLNSACPKDYYPLPNIDCKVEAVMGFKYKCFLDAYKGYHQIQMAKEDEEKTAFYTEQGTYYKKKPVDDMVIKSKEETSLLADIAETFESLKTINMKLNPKKCSFGVEEGKFLGYMVTSEGIRANPKKTRAISDLQSPKTLKEMQSLSGKLASLNRFLQPKERNYSPLEKLASLINMTRRLRRYFEAHPVKVITDQPIKNILSRTEASGKLAKYAVEIGTYKILLHTAECIGMDPLTRCGRPQFEKAQEPARYHWTQWECWEYAYATPLNIATLINETEYEAHPAGLQILVEVLSERSTEVQEVQTIVEEEGDNWMTPIIKYLEEGIVPSDKNEARALRAKIGQYTMESGNSIMALAFISVGNGNHTGPLTLAKGGAKCTKVLEIQHDEHQRLGREKEKADGRPIAECIKSLLYFKQAKQWPKTCPFSLTYRSEAVIPAEIGMPSYRTLMIREEFNEEEQRLNLDLLQERREAAAIREARYKSKMEQYYNKKVRPAGFRPGEFYLRKGNERAEWIRLTKLVPNGKAHTGSQKHSRMAPTNCKQWRNK
ncbi:reverse transcriptase domain-containing protein [Tanacetum coccineum]|uniref:Reverse transcriptase domain-containing protein n=1 Tax=Tanacetum coccineum TaxID=301880 RepID=A0ABQ4XW14_9ASTR